MTPSEFAAHWAPKMAGMTPRERGLTLALVTLVDRDLAYLDGYVCEGQISRCDILAAREALDRTLGSDSVSAARSGA